MARKNRPGSDKQHNGPAIEIPKELALEVWKSLPEKDVVDMLRVSRPFVEICNFVQQRKVSREKMKSGKPTGYHVFMEFIDRRGQLLRADPVYAMETFLTNRRAGFRPPEWALQWIEEAFRKWLDAQGGTSLDSVMGLNGQGKRRAFRAAQRRAKQLKSFVEVARLVALGATVREAAYMVCCLQDPTGWASNDPDESDRLERKANTLAQQYMRFPARKELKCYYDVLLPELDARKMGEYLATFPEASVPPKLRPFLKF